MTLCVCQPLCKQVTHPYEILIEVQIGVKREYHVKWNLNAEMCLTGRKTSTTGV